MYPLGTTIKPEIVPSLTNQNPDNPDLPREERNRLNHARKIGKILAKVIDTRKTKQEKFTRVEKN